MSIRSKRFSNPVLAFAALLSAASPVRAEEVEQLTLADDPFETTDPHATDPGQAELAFVTIYQRARQGAYRNSIALDGEIQVGAAPGLDVRLGQRGVYGGVDPRGAAGSTSLNDGSGSGSGSGSVGGLGATRLGALYQFTDGQGALPIVSTLARVRSTYSTNLPAYEGDFVLLLGKSVGSGARAVGINMNLGWTSRFNPILSERPGLYSLDATFGGAVTSNAVAVFGYSRRQQERGQRDLSLVEAGLRYRMDNDGPVFGFAVGAGLTRDSPAIQISLGAQWSFGLWR